MKALPLISVLLIASSAAPISEDAQANIVQYDNTNDGDGNYEFSFETSNGLRRSESGTLINRGQPDEHIQVKGSYSYIDQDGKYVVINYTADENGYHVVEDSARPPFTSSSFSGPVSPAVLATLLGR